MIFTFSPQDFVAIAPATTAKKARASFLTIAKQKGQGTPS